jgi:hypothetical protein
MGRFIGSSHQGHAALTSDERRLRRQQNPGGIVDRIIGMFSPFTSISRELQSMFQLDRPPACRAEHGRFEILLRGAGMTAQPVDQRVALANELTDAVRPILRAEHKRKYRRYAERAISVVFEDEQVAGEGIATSRFSYVASFDHDPDHAFNRNLQDEHGKREGPRR